MFCKLAVERTASQAQEPGRARRIPARFGEGTLESQLTLTRGDPGTYNIADDDGAVSIDKARRELGFDPTFRLPA